MQKAEVLDLDIQDTCSESDEGSISIVASKFKTPTKIVSHYNVLDLSGTSGSVSHTKVKTNGVPHEKREASPTNTSSYGTQSISETSIIYLDDLKVRPLNPEDSNGRQAPRSVDSWNNSASSGSISNVTKKLGKPRLKKKSVPPEIELHHYFSAAIPLSNNRDQMLFKNRHSLDSSIDNWNAQNHSCSSSSHVHPKLPNYDDVVAKLTDLKTKHSQRKSFYY